MRAFAPVIAAERHAAVVEPDPCPGDKLRMHEYEPSVRIVLRRAGLACYIRVDAEARANARSGAAISLREFLSWYPVAHKIAFFHRPGYIAADEAASIDAFERYQRGSADFY